jgi:putative transposase
MSTYTQILYQIVFSTKNRERTLSKDKREDLFKYISGIIRNKKSHLYQIGGIEDHIHIVTHLHPTIALSDLVKDIKLASTIFIKENRLFMHFNAWQEGYGAFTYSIKEKDRLIEYVKNQEAHHHKNSFKEEYIKLLNEHGIEFDEKYLL